MSEGSLVMEVQRAGNSVTGAFPIVLVLDEGTSSPACGPCGGHCNGPSPEVCSENTKRPQSVMSSQTRVGAG